ncbi:MAG TPA: sensor histidine kinase, partial [Paracoccaceae bacterium]|nr:sensor histidine kinase [Paracoccaceae bacterium]
SAPAELRDAGEAFETMVDSVLHDEAEIADALHQKEVLLREVHHRVKNNLQLIASIMNLQMRKALSPEAKIMVKGLHDRVLSLATVHRELYQTSGLADVRADELLGKIVALVMRMGATPGGAPVVETRLEGLRLTPDQAVPLSLILTEALTNVLKHARPSAEGPARLRVRLERSGEGRARLSIANSIPEETTERTLPPAIDSTGLGSQLLSAFAMQIGGQLDIERGRDGFTVAVDFPIRALSEAESRFAET